MGFLKFLIPVFVLGPVYAKTLLVLPLAGDTAKSADFATINGLYKDALQGAYSGEVKTLAADSARGCSDKGCAAKLAAASGADEVIFGSLTRLGSKWVFSSTILDAKGKDPFYQRATAQSLEDLEAVTKRVGDALLARRNVEEVASLDNITAKEEGTEPTRRRSLYTTGFALGYMIPAGGTYAYLKSNGGSEFGSECPCHEEQTYSQLISLAWLNSWEFRENLLLDVEANWALPNVVGGDVNLQYLFSKSDFAPFAGGGLGIQYVAPLDDTTISTKRNSGPTLNAQGGMVLFRTYDIHVIARAQYKINFNSDMDNGPTFDLGVVYRPREKSGDGGGFWGSFWKYYLIGALVIGVVGAVSGN